MSKSNKSKWIKVVEEDTRHVERHLAERFRLPRASINLDEWYEAKKHWIALLGGVRKSFPIVVEADPSEVKNILTEFQQYQFRELIINAGLRIVQDEATQNRVLHIESRSIPEEYADFFKPGMKLGRALGKIAEEFPERLGRYSGAAARDRVLLAWDNLQKRVRPQKGWYIISVEPLEFYMSSTNGLTSCYNVEDNGCHKAATLQLMYQPEIAMSYIYSKHMHSDITDDERPRKKWRSLLYHDYYDKWFKQITVGREFPAHHQPFLQKATDHIASLFPNKEDILVREERVSLYMNTSRRFGTSLMYNDRPRLSLWDESVQQHEIEELIIGVVETPCPECGGGEIEQHGAMACPDCWPGDYECARCGEPYDSEDLTYIDSEDRDVCRDCLDDDYIFCAECGEYYNAESMCFESIDGHYRVCEHCIQRLVDRGEIIFCEECREFVSEHPSNYWMVGDDPVCDSCVDFLLSQGTIFKCEHCEELFYDSEHSPERDSCETCYDMNEHKEVI